ncbi:MAG: translocation/assembly module TamB domain-containing protein [Candidatus Eisenbacteria bacterium]
MTEPREPDPDRPDDAEPGLVRRLGERVEGAVERAEERVTRAEHALEEAVDEAIGGVVEHVPEAARKPLRWTVRKIVLLVVIGAFVLAVLGTAGTAYYLWNHTSYAAHELTGRINAVLRERSDVELTLDGLRGNPLGTVTVVHPQVRFRDRVGPSFLEADAMRLRWSTWDLLWSRRGALVIEMDHPVLRLENGPDGRLRVPSWEAGPPTHGVGRAWSFELRLRDGELQTPDTALATRGLDVDLRYVTDPARLDLRSLSWRQGPWGSRLDRLSGDVAVGDSVVVRVTRLESPDLALTARATWPRAGGPRQVHADVQRVRWAWLARVFVNDVLDVPGSARFSADLTGERSWSGRAHAVLDWDATPITTDGRFTFDHGRLVVSPLSGDSPIGRLDDGRVTWSSAGWSVEGRGTGANPAEWGVLGVEGWPAGKLDGHFRYLAETGRVRRGHLSADLATCEWTGWHADSGHVEVEFPANGPVSFGVRASRRHGTLTLDGQTADDGWSGDYTVHEFPLDEWPDGRASGIRGWLADGSGSVHGVGGGLDVRGTLEGHATDWFGATMNRWRLSRVEGRLLPTPDLTADARLENLMFLGLHWDSATTTIHLGDRRLHFDGLRVVAGDTLVSMDGDTDWDESGWRLDAGRARMTSRHFDWTAEPPLRLAGDRDGVQFTHVTADDGNASFTAEGRWGSPPHGRYAWRGHAHQLDLARLGLPDDWGLGGIADAEITVDGVSGDPHWTFTGSARHAAFGGHAADSVALSLGGAPHLLEVRQATLVVGSGAARGSGRVSGTARAWPDSLTFTGITRWLADAASWEGRAVVSRIAIDRCGAVWPAALDWSGTLNGRATFGGRPSAPEFHAEADAAPLVWRGFSLGSATLEADYQQGTLSLKTLKMSREGLRFDAKGTLPLDLALGTTPQVPERPMAFQVSLPDGDLGIAPQLVPQIGYAAGRFVVEAQVAGTAKHPELSGRVAVRDGRVRLAGREEVLEQVRADAHLSADAITIDSLSAVQPTHVRGQRGTITGSGWAKLGASGPGDYRFDLAMRDFTAIEPGWYVAEFDGDVVVSNGPKVHGTVVPRVTSDDVRVRRAVVLYDFTRQTETQAVAASTQPLFWVYRLHLTANDNVQWKPADADIEFSADLVAEQTPDSLLLYGDLTALRGTYYFLANKFTVDRANLSFDNVGGVDPTLDIQATTQISTTANDPPLPGEQSVKYDIVVGITGRSREPAITFNSNPTGLDEARILRELTLGGPTRGFGSVVGDPLDSYLTRQINRQLSSELSHAFNGWVNEWELSRESGGLFTGSGDVVVGVGSQINRNLAVRYRQRVPGTTRLETLPNTAGQDLFERDMEAEYRLNRFFSVTSEVAQRRSLNGAGASVTAAPTFNVNLRARWEY